VPVPGPEDDPLALALVQGFFYKSARKMHNCENYLLLHPRGTVVELSPQSVFSMTGVLPSHLVFTELAGQNHHCAMQTVTAVRPEWIKTLLLKTENLDLFRLAGIRFEEREPAPAPVKRTRE
jgi:hypothetical protein